MKFQLNHTFRDYVAAGDETTRELLDSDSALVAAVDEFDAFFREKLWAGDIEMSPQQAFLSMNAFMIYLSSVRMAMSGHAAATYPLFRTALESACYAYLMSQDDELQRIWNDRHDSTEAMKLCRKRFTTAVRQAAHAIEAAHGEQGPAKWIMDCYEAAIDFGAHPNPHSIYHHITEPKDMGEHHLVSLVGLHSSNAFEVSRSLLACLDYGLVIAVVLANGLKSWPERLSDELAKLHETKEEVTKALFPEAYEAMTSER